MNKTRIEWVKNPDGSQGYTLSDKTGCLNHINGMCKGGNFPCYAYKLAHGRLRQAYLGGNCVPAPYKYNSDFILDPFYPRFWPERLKRIPQVRMFRSFPWEPDRKGFFLDDMSDWMGDYWPKEWTEAELQMMKDNPYHRIYTLTKQPQNLIKFSPFPDNCWVGVTACNGEMYQRAILWLDQVKAKMKFISFEPLLGRVNQFDLPMHGINWLIIGAQTKPYKPPKIEWVEEIVRAADKAGVLVFLKDNLKPLLPFPEQIFLKKYYGNYHIRQEMPC